MRCPLGGSNRQDSVGGFRGDLGFSNGKPPPKKPPKKPQKDIQADHAKNGSKTRGKRGSHGGNCATEKETRAQGSACIPIRQERIVEEKQPHPPTPGFERNPTSERGGKTRGKSEDASRDKVVIH